MCHIIVLICFVSMLVIYLCLKQLLCYTVSDCSAMLASTDSHGDKFTRMHTLIKKYNQIVRHNMHAKLNDPVFDTFVDKLKFKLFCSSIGVKTFKTLHIYDDVDEIDFSTSASNYILKSNKASGRNIIVKDGYIVTNTSCNNKQANQCIPYLRSQMKKWSDKYWNHKNEPQYEYTSPKIFEEEFIEDIPDDIKISVYEGEMLFGWIDKNRFGKRVRNFFDFNFNRIACRGQYSTTDDDHLIDRINKDKRLVKMLRDTAEKIAKAVPLDLVRVDLYLYNDEVYGGEVTLSPNAGNTIIRC